MQNVDHDEEIKKLFKGAPAGLPTFLPLLLPWPDELSFPTFLKQILHFFDHFRKLRLRPQLFSALLESPALPLSPPLFLSFLFSYSPKDFNYNLY